MGDIKSAFEIAMEKVRQMEEPTEEERLEWKYKPEGEKLAGRFLKDKVNLVSELGNFDEKGRKYVINAACAVLARNIALPATDHIRQNNKKVMDGIKSMKKDKTAVENIYSRIRYIFDHYSEQGEKQKKQAYEALKQEIGQKIQMAMRQQTGGKTSQQINPESLPQFQQEWKKLEADIDHQYLSHLNEYISDLLETE